MEKVTDPENSVKVLRLKVFDTVRGSNSLHEPLIEYDAMGVPLNSE